jgi:hypothetical protein
MVTGCSKVEIALRLQLVSHHTRPPTPTLPTPLVYISIPRFSKGACRLVCWRRCSCGSRGIRTCICRWRNLRKFDNDSERVSNRFRMLWWHALAYRAGWFDTNRAHLMGYMRLSVILRDNWFLRFSDHCGARKSTSFEMTVIYLCKYIADQAQDHMLAPDETS